MNCKHLFITATVLSILSVMCYAQPITDIDKIKSVEANLMTSFVIKGQPIPAHTIAERMEYHKIPGLSIAFIENDDVKWTRSYGLKKAGSSEPVTEETIFQAGSVSKPVAAAMALCLVKQGRITLDNDVDAYLKSWNLPESKFLNAEKVTLRRMLSHNAGLTIHGFSGYLPDEKLPTLIQILNGESPAKNRKIVVDTVPGTIWRYSGGGYAILQQLLEDVTHKSFDQLASEEIFQKLAMKHSTFQQPLSGKLEKMSATGHSVFGNAFEKNFVQPELAAGGLWSTPTDLARFLIEIVKANAWLSNTILTQELAGLMLTPQFRNWGLGFSINGSTVSHPGSCEGFRTILLYQKEKKQGVIMMANAENGDNLMREIINSVAKVYGWSHFSPREREMYSLSEDIYKKYSGKYEVNPDIRIEIRYEQNSLKVYMNNELRTILYPETEKKFFILEDRHAYTFITNENGEVLGISIQGVAPNIITAKKVYN